MSTFSNIKGDISGGISAAVIALPLALAFGVSAFVSIGTPEALARGAAAGMPRAGATVRTVVNIQNGGRTRISGILHGLVLLSILVALEPAAGWIPMCVLAAILIVTAISMLDILGSSGPKKDVRFTSLGPGLYFGEMALLERSVRSARAVADQDCELYVLQMEDIEKLMEEDAMIGTRILQTMAKGLSRRLRRVSAELTALESM